LLRFAAQVKRKPWDSGAGASAGNEGNEPQDEKTSGTRAPPRQGELAGSLVLCQKRGRRFSGKGALFSVGLRPTGACGPTAFGVAPAAAWRKILELHAWGRGVSRRRLNRVLLGGLPLRSCANRLRFVPAFK